MSKRNKTHLIIINLFYALVVACIITGILYAILHNGENAKEYNRHMCVEVYGKNELCK